MWIGGSPGRIGATEPMVNRPAGDRPATALIANPLQDVVKLVGIYLRAIFVIPPNPNKLIERIVEHKLCVFLAPKDRPTGYAG